MPIAPQLYSLRWGKCSPLAHVNTFVVEHLVKRKIEAERPVNNSESGQATGKSPKGDCATFLLVSRHAPTHVPLSPYRRRPVAV
jgi:hypothetical protein